MKKKKRLIMRTMILFVLLCAVGYTLYANLFQKEQNQRVVVGDAAPDFALSTLNGDDFQLSDHEGKAVLVNFWGSWCGPCKKEMPAIQDAYEHYKDENFEVVTINIRESEFTVNKFFENNGLSIPVVMDKDGEVYDRYGIHNLPASFFITQDGTVKRMVQGEMNRQDIDQWIEEVLPKS
ncbi:thiol-disulfide oxidoreductase ResA [Bacillus salacetis]|uniref:Thiol-disulfide oxidoreductase ResA n=1 Tax=Bacillus salacetis TaxID=2315464 RepID=A0A3A1QY39_9BACI|nr:thiol-disulfide oxidoreductase ResA [Bacillus salacetis]RIW32066.1 thiol-disulfide oxidoreductase ResA [Bacillus salacetis]